MPTDHELPKTQSVPRNDRDRFRSFTASGLVHRRGGTSGVRSLSAGKAGKREKRPDRSLSRNALAMPAQVAVDLARRISCQMPSYSAREGRQRSRSRSPAPTEARRASSASRPNPRWMDTAFLNNNHHRTYAPSRSTRRVNRCYSKLYQTLSCRYWVAPYSTPNRAARTACGPSRRWPRCVYAAPEIALTLYIRAASRQFSKGTGNIWSSPHR